MAEFAVVRAIQQSRERPAPPPGPTAQRFAKEVYKATKKMAMPSLISYFTSDPKPAAVAGVRHVFNRLAKLNPDNSLITRTNDLIQAGTSLYGLTGRKLNPLQVAAVVLETTGQFKGDSALIQFLGKQLPGSNAEILIKDTNGKLNWKPHPENAKNVGVTFGKIMADFRPSSNKTAVSSSYREKMNTRGRDLFVQTSRRRPKRSN